MTKNEKVMVMDVLPWPDGRGFTGADAWWAYVLSKDERRRLDNLLGLALLDQDVCDRLVNQRDDSLFMAFGLSDQARAWLRAIPANSLTELAEAILAGVQETPYALKAAS